MKTGYITQLAKAAFPHYFRAKQFQRQRENLNDLLTAMFMIGDERAAECYFETIIKRKAAMDNVKLHKIREFESLPIDKNK